MGCSYCKATTHNARTCSDKLPLTELSPLYQQAKQKTHVKHVVRRVIMQEPVERKMHQILVKKLMVVDKVQPQMKVQMHTLLEAQLQHLIKFQMHILVKVQVRLNKGKSPLRTKHGARKQVPPVKRRIITAGGSQQTETVEAEDKQWKGQPVTTLRQLEAARNVKSQNLTKLSKRIKFLFM